MDFQIAYSNKVDEKTVVSQTPSAELSVERSVGKVAEPPSKLIQGDNLTRLKALVDDP